VLQGVVQGQPGGDASEGKRRSPSARQGNPRPDADDRCLGPDAYRLGGARLCQQTPVRTDRLDGAVWGEVWTLLAHPERLAEEYRRRLPPDTRPQRPALDTVEAHLGKLRQGLARLIDRDAEGLMDQHAFTPRLLRGRRRIAAVEAQRRQLADAAAQHRALPLLMGRLEDVAATGHHG
jgi:site-specific DNA recombinase